MAGPSNKKRLMGSKFQKPMKRQKRERRVQKEYHSSTEDEGEGEDQQQDFDAVNLLDSDDDIHNAKADDIGAEEDGSGLSSSEDEAPSKKAGAAKGSAKLKAKMPKKLAANDDSTHQEGLLEDEDDDGDDDDEDEDMNDEFDLGDDDDDEDEDGSRRPKKRNDPAAFATSLSKILSTKLSSSKRADPVLARSAAAHETSRAVLDSALEAKAKRALREQKRKAQEKGRVRDVLLAPVAVAAAPAGPGREEKPEVTTGDILAAEAKLRKVAQRGVVKMFNAVRTAQVKSTEAERATRQAGVIGMARREEKVNEMSKKGFLDLLASGGSALNKSASAIEEA
ncbi:Ribosomal RNA-processing protein 15 [Beauveria bassiana]|uniref:Ribosomal RNA-processing protein 15 n=1 Tax=Beauveria bassiana TaxID=176275 RepID=A0A2N6NNH7_BEABA|nr:Ribosomal RNA-processing protein 15 [Beauveria bassiana]